MTFRVFLQPEAERTIQRQAYWLAEQSKSASVALRWVRSIRSKINTLKTSPYRCPVDPDSDAYGEEVRLLLFGKRTSMFRILFVIHNDVVRVVAIRHTSQRSLSEELESWQLGPDDEEPLH